MKKTKTVSKHTEDMFRAFLDMHDLDGADFDDTPRRVARMWETFFHTEKPALPAFPTTNNEMVVLKDIEVWGFCPHHLLPIRYTIKIGYIPSDKVLGLSKLARLAKWCVSRLPLQENLPCMITDELQQLLKPLGCGCQVTGFHLCIAMRGVEQNKATFVTTSLKGIMLLSPASQHEFLTT